jgi:hypothetical protein
MQKVAVVALGCPKILLKQNTARSLKKQKF